MPWEGGWLLKVTSPISDRTKSRLSDPSLALGTKQDPGNHGQSGWFVPHFSWEISSLRLTAQSSRDAEKVRSHRSRNQWVSVFLCNEKCHQGPGAVRLEVRCRNSQFPAQRAVAFTGRHPPTGSVSWKRVPRRRAPAVRESRTARIAWQEGLRAAEVSLSPAKSCTFGCKTGNVPMSPDGP